MYFTPQHQRKADLEYQGQGKSTQSQSSVHMRLSESQQKESQIVFICGGGNDLTRWATPVKVHVAPPLTRRSGSKPEKPCACENCDVIIYQNLNRAFWAQVGSWRRYLSFFYGVVKVEEVKFQIRSRGKDWYNILLERLDYKKIEEDANSQIHYAESPPEDLERMDVADDPSFYKQTAEARLRLKGLKSLGFLTENFKIPATAADGSLLKGLAQISCVYDGRSLRLPQSAKEAVQDTNYYRGLNVELGWHIMGIPRNNIVALIGAGLATWKYMNGDLDTASALAIFLAILAPHAFSNLKWVG